MSATNSNPDFKTYSVKPSEVTRKWVLVDASDHNLGRVAGTIAHYLIGKYKPSYSPHIDGGDYVVVINSDELKVAGNKETDKVYYRHSGYPGGISSATLKEVREKDSTRIIREAVKGMLPKNKLVDGRLARLKIYTGSEHLQAPQSPEKVEVK